MIELEIIREWVKEKMAEGYTLTEALEMLIEVEE